MCANRYNNHEKILLVNKQGRWLSFSQAVLKTAGYVVSVTNSITDAWHLVSQNGTAFDLILVDLKRVEMESDLFQQLAGPRGKRRPVVVLSPTTLTPSRMSYFFKLGAYDCLEKKYDEKGLVSLVKNLLGETTIPRSSPPDTFHSRDQKPGFSVDKMSFHVSESLKNSDLPAQTGKNLVSLPKVSASKPRSNYKNHPQGCPVPA